MKRVFYEKKGRRYVPVREYDSDLMNSFPEGSHLIVCVPGETCRRYNIDPQYAPMIAAGLNARKTISEAMMKASELRPHRELITVEQRQAWDALAQAFGDGLATLETNSVYNIVEEGIEAMVREQEKLLKYPAVKKAYEHFLSVAALTKEHTGVEE